MGGSFLNVDVCVEPVLKLSEVVQHPQTQAREMIVEFPKPDVTTQQQIGNPIKFSKGQPSYKHVGAALGEHSEKILLDAGFSKAEIMNLVGVGITVGQATEDAHADR